MTPASLSILALLWVPTAGLVVPVAFLLARQIWRSSMGHEYLDLWVTIVAVMLIATIVAFGLALPWLVAFGVLDLVPDSPWSF